MKVQVKTLLPIAKIQHLVELEAQYKSIKQQIDEYRADLLKITQDLDVLSLRTGQYTISRAKRITPQVTSFKTLKASLEAESIPYDTMEVFTPQTLAAFREVAKIGKDLDGLAFQETEYITIRTKEVTK